MAARPPDVERHTGMDFEAGHVHRARNVEEQPPGGMITGGERVTVPGASPDPGGAVSPARSTRASAGERSAEPSPRDERAAARTANRRAEDDLAAILRKPWRGQADSVKGVQKKVLAQFEEKGLRKKKMEDGVSIDYAVTKYWVKYDGEDAAEETTRLNITRMFAKLLKSKKCPDEIKLELAKELNNTAAIRGNQRQSEAIRGHQRPSEAIRGHQRPSEAIRGHQRQS